MTKTITHFLFVVVVSFLATFTGAWAAADKDTILFTAANYISPSTEGRLKPSEIDHLAVWRANPKMLSPVALDIDISVLPNSAFLTIVTPRGEMIRYTRQKNLDPNAPQVWVGKDSQSGFIVLSVGDNNSTTGGMIRNGSQTYQISRQKGDHIHIISEVKHVPFKETNGGTP